MTLKFHLRDRNEGMVEAWRAVFRNHADFTISQGDIFAEDVPAADAIVSPANSFGFMNGGIDLVYSEYFGWDLESRLRHHIEGFHDGLLPVGQATIVETKHERFPLLISAPTMTIPMNIEGTINAFLAFRAVIRVVNKYNKGLANNYEYGHPPGSKPIETILCPGLGTAIGKLPYMTAAIQMNEAWHACQIKPLEFEDLNEAWNYHTRLRKGLT